MKPGGQRAKGNTFERWVAAAINKAFGLTGEAAAHRGLSQTRGGGAEVSDVVFPGWPLHIEAKHSKADTVRTAIRQATADLHQRRSFDVIPVAVVRKHGTSIPVVGLYARDASVLLNAAHGLGPRSLTTGVLGLDRAEFPRGDDHPLVTLTWPDFLALLLRVKP